MIDMSRYVWRDDHRGASGDIDDVGDDDEFDFDGFDPDYDRVERGRRLGRQRRTLDASSGASSRVGDARRRRERNVHDDDDVHERNFGDNIDDDDNDDDDDVDDELHDLFALGGGDGLIDGGGDFGGGDFGGDDFASERLRSARGRQRRRDELASPTLTIANTAIDDPMLRPPSSLDSTLHETDGNAGDANAHRRARRHRAATATTIGTTTSAGGEGESGGGGGGGGRATTPLPQSSSGAARATPVPGRVELLRVALATLSERNLLSLLLLFRLLHRIHSNASINNVSAVDLQKSLYPALLPPSKGDFQDVIGDLIVQFDAVFGGLSDDEES